jgi:hypothetical protein
MKLLNKVLNYVIGDLYEFSLEIEGIGDYTFLHRCVNPMLESRRIVRNFEDEFPVSQVKILFIRKIK